MLEQHPSSQARSTFSCQHATKNTNRRKHEASTVSARDSLWTEARLVLSATRRWIWRPLSGISVPNTVGGTAPRGQVMRLPKACPTSIRTEYRSSEPDATHELSAIPAGQVLHSGEGGIAEGRQGGISRRGATAS
jgi:hypothetical protein